MTAGGAGVYLRFEGPLEAFLQKEAATKQDNMTNISLQMQFHIYIRMYRLEREAKNPSCF